MTAPLTVPDAAGHFGRFGGRFVPEALIVALDQLDAHQQAATAHVADLLVALHHRLEARAQPRARDEGALGMISRFLGEPADGDVTVRNQTHQLVLAHSFSDAWRGRVALSYRETDLLGFSTEPTALQASGLLTRQRRFRDYNSDDTALQAELAALEAANTLLAQALFFAQPCITKQFCHSDNAIHRGTNFMAHIG